MQNYTLLPNTLQYMLSYVHHKVTIVPCLQNVWQNTSQSNSGTCQHKKAHTEKEESAYKQSFPKYFHSGFTVDHWTFPYLLNIAFCVLCSKFKDLSVYSEANTQGGLFFFSMFFLMLNFSWSRPGPESG